MSDDPNFGGSGITLELFLHVLKLLPPGKIILEFGSGDVSTHYLSQHYTLFSVEDQAQWLNRHPGVMYIHAPLVDGWYDLAKVLPAIPPKPDLILVDGPSGEWNRGGFLKNIDKFYHDCLIVFDDTNREGERTLAMDTCLKLGRIACWYESFAVILPNLCQEKPPTQTDQSAALAVESKKPEIS